MVLKGHKVDIVTSNPILAKRDAKEADELFAKFGISVGCNIEGVEKSFFDFLINQKKNVI